MMLYVLIFPKRILNLAPREKTTNKTYYVYIIYKIYIVYNVYINPSLLEAQHSKKISLSLYEVSFSIFFLTAS